MKSGTTARNWRIDNLGEELEGLKSQHEHIVALLETLSNSLHELAHEINAVLEEIS